MKNNNPILLVEDDAVDVITTNERCKSIEGNFHRCI